MRPGRGRLQGEALVQAALLTLRPASPAGGPFGRTARPSVRPACPGANHIVCASRRERSGRSHQNKPRNSSSEISGPFSILCRLLWQRVSCAEAEGRSQSDPLEENESLYFKLGLFCLTELNIFERISKKIGPRLP